jgi:peptidoglycan/LPS O-acetylase OafA/YrhL
MKIKRYPLPARITLALVLVLITIAWGLLRLWSGVSFGPVLQKYSPQPGPVYIAFTGAVWAVLGLVLLWGFWRRRAWAPGTLLGAALGYVAWTWFDRLLIQPQPGSNWPFSLLVSAAALAFIAAAALDPRNRSYFGREAHEREEQDRPTA